MRTRSTADYFLSEMNFSKNGIVFLDEIYEARWDTLLAIVNALDDSFKTVAMIGHNPGFSQLSTYLSGEVVEMPTCAIVTIVFEFDHWQMISGNTGEMIRFDFPKKHI